MKTKNVFTIQDLGCNELYVEYKGFRCFWIPELGRVRLWGQNVVATVCGTRRELVAWVMARA